MIIDTDTLKIGTTIYFVYVSHNKYTKSWRFIIRKEFIFNVGNSPYSNNIEIDVDSRCRSNTDDTMPFDHRRFYIVDKERLLYNNKTFFLRGADKSSDADTWTYFTDSIKTAIKLIKDAVVLKKTNETTKKARLNTYRKLVLAWIKAPYKENFLTDIQ